MKGKLIFLAALGLLPIWRSGAKGGLTFYGWVINHTVFGDFPEYIPREQYDTGFCGPTYVEADNG